MGRQANEYDAARNSDLVKNHACSSAGIPILRVLQDHAPSAVHMALKEALGIKEKRPAWRLFSRRRGGAAIGREEPPLR